MARPPVVGESRSGPRAQALLAEAARAVHGVRDRDRVAKWVVDAARVLGAADTAALCLRSSQPDGGWLWVAGDATVVLPDPRHDPLLLPAVRGEATVRVSSDDGPEVTASFVAGMLGPGALLVVPVVGQDERPSGLLAVGRRSQSPFEDEAEESIVALSAHVAVALENLGAFERLVDREVARQEIVHQLQDAVRPVTPVVPNSELGVWYVAAEEGVPTGGDLYDWLVLPDGSVHVAVVDVMGKGVAATKDALAVTHALRLLVLDGCPLGDVVRRADELLTAQNPDLVATLLVAHYSPATGEVRLAGAGHPPAMLVSSGSAREINAPGIPIGWPGASSFEVARAVLDRSDSLLLYTDGLIESSKDIIDGLDRLARFAVDTSEYPAAFQARALVERTLAGAVRRDDSLALVVRRRVPPRQSARLPLAPFEYRFTPAPAAVPLARHLLEDWLVRVPVEEAATPDLLLIASELLANAIRHATGAERGVALRAWADAGDVVIEVEDDGAGLAWPGAFDDHPDPSEERGRGLFLVQALADEVVPQVRATGTTVRCVKRAVIATH